MAKTVWKRLFMFMAVALLFSLVFLVNTQKVYADTSNIIEDYEKDESNILRNDGKLWFVQMPGATLKLIGYKGVLSETFEIPTEFDDYPVTEIGNQAFRDATELTGTLTIPSCIESIGDGAFEGCTGLTGLEMKNGLKYIGNSAFDSCRGLTGDLIFPNSVISIGGAAFEFCTGFTGSIRFPENPNFTKIPGHLLYHAGTFTGQLLIPDNVTEIGSNAFSFTRFNNVTLTLSRNLKLIGHWAFYGSSGLVGSLELPDGLQTIEYGAFLGCSGFTGDLNIPNSVTKIEESAFRDMPGLNGTLHIPENLEIIENRTFESCSKLTGDIVIPDSVKEIGEKAFCYDRGFNGTITFPDNENFTEIKNETFYLCQNLTGTVNIPTGVTRIGDRAFRDCNKLTGLILPQGLHNICTEAFLYCQSIAGTLELPGSLTEIGDSAFYNCEKLTGSLTIPHGVQTIQSYAFRGCSGLDGTLTIENGVKNIGSYAFMSCRNLTGPLTLPASVESVGGSAFYCCENLSGALTLSSALRYIGNDAFYSCENLTGPLTLPETLTEIGAYAFYECTGFTGDLTIPGNTTGVYQFAFRGCTGLTGTLTIPESVTSLGNYAFGDDFFATIINNSEKTIPVQCKEDTDYPTNYILSSSNCEIYCYRDAAGDRVSEIGKGTYTLGRLNGIDPATCEHEWELTFTITPAGCTANGGGEYTCSKCGTTKTDIIPALGHDMQIYEFGAGATCTEDGSQPYCYCKRCNKYFIDAEGENEIDGIPVIKAKGHDYKDIVTKATLTKDGQIVPTCSVCGATKTATKIAKVSKISISKTKYVYNGKVQKPTLTVKDSAGNVIASKYYTVKWSNTKSKAVGKYTVTVTFKGNYSGTKAHTYTIVPKAVTGVKAASSTTKSIKLSWSKATGAKNYAVYGSADGKTFKKITTVSTTGAKITKVNGKALAAGKTYYFKVRAMDSTQKLIGEYSKVLKTGTLTAAPKITKLTSTKSKTATVTWGKVTGAKSYAVYKSTDGKKWTKAGTATGTSFTLTKLTGGKKIYVKVLAVNAYKANSAYSEEKSVTVKK